MGQDAVEVGVQVVGYVRYEGLLVVGHAVCVLVESFPKLFQQLLGRLGEVLDEVERVADFVGHAGGKFAEGGQLLLHDNLVLGPAQVVEHRLKLLVFVLKLLGQFFDQIQPLYFQGVLPEYVQGRGHVGDFVVAAYFDPGVQVAAGHAAHPVREHFDAAQQHAANQQPGDEECAANAHGGNGQQEGPAFQDGLAGSRGGSLGVVPGSHDETVNLRDEGDRFVLIGGQQFPLHFNQAQFLLQQVELALHPQVKICQPGEDGRQFVVYGRAFQRRQVALNAADGRFEPLPQRFDERWVGKGEGVGQQLGGNVGVGLQFGQVAVAADFSFREVGLEVMRFLAQAAVPGNGVEKLVVNGRHQGIGDQGAYPRQVLFQAFPFLGQLE